MLTNIQSCSPPPKFGSPSRRLCTQAPEIVFTTMYHVYHLADHALHHADHALHPADHAHHQLVRTQGGEHDQIRGVVRMVPGSEHNLGACVHNRRDEEANLGVGEHD